MNARCAALVRLALPLVSAALAVASFPPAGAWPLAWVALVPLLAFLAREPRAARRVAASALAGTVFFAAGCVWLTRTTVPGWLALSVYAGGGSWALFAWLAAPALQSANPWARRLGPPAAWVVSEYLRGVLPANLPWLFLAHGQAAFPPLVQSASWGGAWLVSALVVAGNVALHEALAAYAPGPKRRPSRLPRDRRDALEALTVGALGPVCLALAGFAGTREAPGGVAGAGTATIRLGIVQPELAPRDKTDPALRDEVLARLRRLSETVAQRSDVILWPESSFPSTLGKDPRALLELAELTRTLGRPLVTGVMTKSDRLRNSLVSLDARGRVTSVYDKQRLVFVAEYLPPWIRGTWLEPLVTRGTRLPHRFDFAPGDRTVLLDLAGVAAAPAICLEHASFARVREAVARGARLVVNAGNEGAFEGTAELAQALQIATLRAVENRVPVVRVMNSGLSGVIEPTGAVRPLPAGARAEVVEVAVPARSRTLYTALGDWLPCVSIAAFAASRARRPLRALAGAGLAGAIGETAVPVPSPALRVTEA